MKLEMLNRRREELERQGDYEQETLGYVTYFTYERWCDILDRIKELEHGK
jgi:hypothetical protein